MPKKSTKKPIGRPSKYSDAIADKICEQLAQGKSLVSICKQTGMPNYSTIMRWLSDAKQSYFRENYARAREDSTEHDLERMAQIIDDLLDDKKDVNPHKARVAIDGLKWIMGRKNPKKYADNPNLFQFNVDNRQINTIDPALQPVLDAAKQAIMSQLIDQERQDLLQEPDIIDVESDETLSDTD